MIFCFRGRKRIDGGNQYQGVYSERLLFPSIRDWEILQELQIPLVVNSDAHRPELIHAGRAEALQQLKEKGFKTVMELREGKWQEVPIV